MTISEVAYYLGRFRVGIAGAGGLGSNCAAALARSGLGTLVIADLDIVEKLNLNRQFYFLDQVGEAKVSALKENIRRINPEIQVIAHKVKLTPLNIPEIFRGCDVIVEAFDAAEMKEMIATVVQTKMPGVPLVMGVGMAGWGNSNSVRCRKIDDCLFVCGDEATEVSEMAPPLAPRVGIAANMQANTVMEILMSRKAQSR